MENNFCPVFERMDEQLASPYKEAEGENKLQALTMSRLAL